MAQGAAGRCLPWRADCAQQDQAPASCPCSKARSPAWQQKRNWPLQRQAPLMGTSHRQKHHVVVLSDLSLRIPRLGTMKGVIQNRPTGEEWIEPPQFWWYHLFKNKAQTPGCFSVLSRSASASGLHYRAVLMAASTSLCFPGSSPAHRCLEQSHSEGDLTPTEAGAMSQSASWMVTMASRQIFFVQPWFSKKSVISSL